MPDSGADEVKKGLLYASGLCARSEQCVLDIRTKLLRRGLGAADAGKIIAYLKANKFIDEQRFADSFVRMKLRQGNWGPRKIRQALLAKGIADVMIRKAMEQSDDDAHCANAYKAALRKAKGLNMAQAADRQKVYRFLMSRGYQGETITRVMSRLGAEADDLFNEDDNCNS